MIAGRCLHWSMVALFFCAMAATTDALISHDWSTAGGAMGFGVVCQLGARAIRDLTR